MIVSSNVARLLIVGSQGHARSIAEVAAAIPHFELVGFVDDYRSPGETVLSWGIQGAVQDILAGGIDFDVLVIGIGDNAARRRVAQRLLEKGCQFATLIHPTSYVSPTATIGVGSVVFPNASIGTQARIKSHVIVNTGAIVDHDCTLGDYSSVSPGCSLAGNVGVGDGSVIGIGASIREQTRIGEHSIVGAGSTVTSDIESFCVAFGSPAREIRGRKAGEKYLRGS